MFNEIQPMGKVLIFCVFSVLLAGSTCFAQKPKELLPVWVSKVGTRSEPAQQRTFLVNKYGADADGTTISTRSIQQAIDECSRQGGGIVTFDKGEYVTGSLFLKDNVNLKIDNGVTLLASQDDQDYPRLRTRVAGIEMTWPAALINVNNVQNAKISGGGTIDGRGQKWWDKFSRVRKEYEPRGLRWAADYDAERVRLMVIWKSSDIKVENLNLKRSGFWTVQVVYSDHVTVDGVKISDNGGPSTDGVDIDSSSHVLVQHCDIDNNDDDICLKSGRDSDGLRVDRPTEYVVIRDNLIRRGGGVVSFGSETSGGIRHVVALNNQGIGTKEGIRFKSAKTRGGYVRDVLVRGLKLDNVPLPFTFTLNWNPSYSYAAIPAGMKDVPAYWTVLSTPVLPAERGFCDFSNIRIEDVNVVGASRIFTASGLPEKPIDNVTFANVTAQGDSAGSIEYATDWKMENVRLRTSTGVAVKITNSRNVESPAVITK
jgi:polygalacturonase